MHCCAPRQAKLAPGVPLVKEIDERPLWKYRLASAQEWLATPCRASRKAPESTSFPLPTSRPHSRGLGSTWSGPASIRAGSTRTTS